MSAEGKGDHNAGSSGLHGLVDSIQDLLHGGRRHREGINEAEQALFGVNDRLFTIDDSRFDVMCLA